MEGMLPSYVDTMLLTLFGIMGDQWVKHRTLPGFNSIYFYYVKV